ncbi:protein FAM149A [Gracilinanus agilis]|uniref:protein FAM149A n=1 Tax=Gracilinanus agilis TaxID=191870 RepID=UPI001CFE73E5|nr:protein FAM149A [Gracilinanus agilis]
MKVAVLDLGSLFAKIFKASVQPPAVASPAATASSSSSSAVAATGPVGSSLGSAGSTSSTGLGAAQTVTLFPTVAPRSPATPRIPSVPLPSSTTLHPLLTASYPRVSAVRKIAETAGSPLSLPSSPRTAKLQPLAQPLPLPLPHSLSQSQPLLSSQCQPSFQSHSQTLLQPLSQPSSQPHLQLLTHHQPQQQPLPQLPPQPHLQPLPQLQPQSFSQPQPQLLTQPLPFSHPQSQLQPLAQVPSEVQLQVLTHPQPQLQPLTQPQPQFLPQPLPLPLLHSPVQALNRSGTNSPALPLPLALWRPPPGPGGVGVVLQPITGPGSNSSGLAASPASSPHHPGPGEQEPGSWIGSGPGTKTLFFTLPDIGEEWGTDIESEEDGSSETRGSLLLPQRESRADVFISSNVPGRRLPLALGALGGVWKPVAGRGRGQPSPAQLGLGAEESGECGEAAQGKSRKSIRVTSWRRADCRLEKGAGGEEPGSPLLQGARGPAACFMHGGRGGWHCSRTLQPLSGRQVRDPKGGGSSNWSRSKQGLIVIGLQKLRSLLCFWMKQDEIALEEFTFIMANSAFIEHLQEFDRATTQKVQQLFLEVDEMLFEGKISPRCQNLQAECEEWTRRSLHLRVLGKQLIFPTDEGFQHFPSHTANSVCTKTSLDLCESNNSLKELCLSGSKLVPADYTQISSVIPDIHASFLEEEIYAVDGKIEEYFAFDKELDDESVEPKTAKEGQQRNKHGLPPISPELCIKDAVTAEAFDRSWRNVVGILEDLLKKTWKTSLEERSKQRRHFETTRNKPAKPSSYRIPPNPLSIPPSRGSETHCVSSASLLGPPQSHRFSSSLHGDLNGVMTIQAKPLQQRYPNLPDKTLHNQEDRLLGTGSSVSASVWNRLGISDAPSSSWTPHLPVRKAPAHRRLPSLSSELHQSKISSVHGDKALRGNKLQIGSDCLSSPSIQVPRNKLPPIGSETGEQNVPTPGSRQAFHRGRYPLNQVLSTIPGNIERPPLQERTVISEQFSRPSTTHTFRSDTPYKGSLTPMEFVNHTWTDQDFITSSQHLHKSYQRNTSTSKRRFPMAS